MNYSRRDFVATGLAAVVGATIGGSGEVVAQRKPAIASELVKEFVGKAHGNLARTKELVAEIPAIVNASWDWGIGDWETALGAASHMGRRDIAGFLREHKARKDVFCAAMQGEADIVEALLAVDPTVALLPGPHKITLLFHAALSGTVDIARMLKKHEAHDDQALHAAVWYGRREMTEWLLDHDTEDVNVIRGKQTALDLAIKKGYSEIADLLRKRGVKQTED
jgi:hypothetical protein